MDILIGIGDAIEPVALLGFLDDAIVGVVSCAFVASFWTMRNHGKRRAVNAFERKNGMTPEGAAGRRMDRQRPATTSTTSRPLSPWDKTVGRSGTAAGKERTGYEELWQAMEADRAGWAELEAGFIRTEARKRRQAEELARGCPCMTS